MKKKYFSSSKDKKDWLDFIQKPEQIYDKDADLDKLTSNKENIVKLDLHGFSLHEANEKAKKLIIDSFNKGYKKLLIITGKGLRSQVYNDPYRSKKMNILKYSVPDFIKKDKDLMDKISSISQPPLKQGGEGAIYVFLKQPKKL